jgi:hypothetical protein
MLASNAINVIGDRCGVEYSSTFSLTSAPGGGEWSLPLPSHFNPSKKTVPIVQEGVWAPEPAWKGVENLATHQNSNPERSRP